MATFPKLNKFNQTIIGLDEQNPNLISTGLPFEIISTKRDVTNSQILIKISFYSNVYSNFSQNESSAMPISGIDYSFPILYPSKIYMETFYDKNLTPIYCKIKSNPTWNSFTIDTATNSKTLTYPNELEFISKLDLTQKLTELNSDRINNENIRISNLQEITDLVNSGYYTNNEGSSAKKIINDRYDSIKSVLDPYISNFSQFFTGFSSNTKKLFKSITIIGYTTKDEFPGLRGQIVSPPTPVNQQSGTQTSTADNSFRIVQCADTDFMIVDVYSNNLAAKTLIPWTRGINKFILPDGNTEEVSNTTS